MELELYRGMAWCRRGVGWGERGEVEYAVYVVQGSIWVCGEYYLDPLCGKERGIGVYGGDEG